MLNEEIIVPLMESTVEIEKPEPVMTEVLCNNETIEQIKKEYETVNFRIAALITDKQQLITALMAKVAGWKKYGSAKDYLNFLVEGNKLLPYSSLTQIFAEGGSKLNQDGLAGLHKLLQLVIQNLSLIEQGGKENFMVAIKKGGLPYLPKTETLGQLCDCYDQLFKSIGQQLDLAGEQGLSENTLAKAEVSHHDWVIEDLFIRLEPQSFENALMK
ncbi:MAG: hypothetical protein WCK11_04750 [Candidatus Falkowbacteria bacterium]